MQIDRAMVLHIAELAKLALTEAEVERFAGQLSDILAYAERLQQVDTEAIPPTASVLPLRTVLREDVAGPSLPREVALGGGADTAAGQFRVEAILGGE